jgi:putative membrane protein
MDYIGAKPNMDETAEKPRDMDALIRMRFQIETSLLGLLRTGLALMAFGFVLARFGFFLRQLASAQQVQVRTPTWLARTNTWMGTFLILLGVAVLLISTYTHRNMVVRLERGDLGLPGRWSIGMVLCMILAAVGMGMAVYLGTVEM